MTSPFPLMLQQEPKQERVKVVLKASVSSTEAQRAESSIGLYLDSPADTARCPAACLPTQALLADGQAPSLPGSTCPCL